MGTAEAQEGGRGKPTNGQWAEPPVQVWPGRKGRGLWSPARQMPSAPRGPLKSPCCQAGQGVCRGRQPPHRLLPPAGAAHPGYALLGACCLLSHALPSGCLLTESVSLSLFSVLFFFCLSLSLPQFRSPLFFLFFFSYHLSFPLVSFHLSVSFIPFPCISFVSLIFFVSVAHFSFSLPLSFSAVWLFLCLALNLERADALE